VPILVITAPSFVGWPQYFAILRAVAPDAPPGDDFVVKLGAGCFPAESTASLASGAAQARLVGAGLWNRDDLQRAGNGAIAFATSVAPRDLEEGWRMRISGVEARYVDERGNLLLRPRRARIAPVPQMTLEGAVASTHFWLLPSDALERLKREPTTRLALTYSVALLEPSTAELVADGERRHVPGLGYCGASYDPADSTLAVDCVKRGTQPAWITADIPGAPLRSAVTPMVSYEPSWLEVFTGQRYRLALQVPPGVDHSRVKLTAYEGRSHFERRLETAGILGAPLADCPLPVGAPRSPVERGIWRDTSPHNVLFVNVADGVRLEVLDWGGSGRPVVLLHGLGATAHSFDDFAPKLAERYRVIGITRRGVGASTLAETGYDLPQLARDVLRVMDALAIDSSAVVMGHSMAGEELNELGARHSDRIAGLVYLDAAADRTLKPTPEMDIVGDALPDAPPAKPESFSSYPALRDYMLRIGGVALPEGEILATFAFTPSGSVGGRTLEPRVLEAIEDAVTKPDYAAFKVPALALYAVPRSADDFMRPWYDRSDPLLRANVQRQYELTVGAFDYMKRAFEEGVPNARAVNLLGAKHYIFASNEADVLAEIERFVSELPPR
jgi:pimeloyl-ACP methyl ester carboxylesterase